MTTRASSLSPPQRQQRSGLKVIKSWVIQDDDLLRLEAAENGGAVIARIIEGDRTEYGTISWDRSLRVHVITWNDEGRRAYKMSRRDSWDDTFYDVMAQWGRSRGQS